jgi:hypothetical protein
MDAARTGWVKPRCVMLVGALQTRWQHITEAGQLSCVLCCNSQQKGAATHAPKVSKLADI